MADAAGSIEASVARHGQRSFDTSADLGHHCRSTTHIPTRVRDVKPNLVSTGTTVARIASPIPKVRARCSVLAAVGLLRLSARLRLAIPAGDADLDLVHLGLEPDRGRRRRPAVHVVGAVALRRAP